MASKILDPKQHIEIISTFPQTQGKRSSGPKSNGNSFGWYCQDCALMLTSQTQAQEHFQGKKHQNVMRSKTVLSNFKFRLNNQSCERNSMMYCERFRSICFSKKTALAQSKNINYEITIPPPAGKDNILETVLKSEKRATSSSDLSIYRTPSGKYYCQPCNLTVNSPAQFLQHSESRKHKHKLSRASFKVK